MSCKWRRQMLRACLPTYRFSQCGHTNTLAFGPPSASICACRDSASRSSMLAVAAGVGAKVPHVSDRASVRASSTDGGGAVPGPGIEAMYCDAIVAAVEGGTCMSIGMDCAST